jgi:hypothetical protein
MIKIKLELPFLPSSHSIVVFFFPAHLLSLSLHFQQVLLGVEVSSVSWLEQLTVGVEITDYFNCRVSKFLLLPSLGCWSLEFKSLTEGRSLYIGSFCPAITSLSNYLEEIFERHTGKKNTTIEWDDGEKGNSNLILTEIFPSVHET